jgi:hypothetical protein
MIDSKSRRLYLFAGVITAAVPALLLTFGILIPGFEFAFELHNVEFSYNVSMFLYIALIFVGVAIAAIYFRSVKTRFVPGAIYRSTGRVTSQYSVVSIPWSRFIAGALLVLVGAISFALLGIGFTDRNKIGVWLYLGGPSVSFPSGLIPLIAGIVLLLYASQAMKKVVMDNQDGVLTIRESRLLTEINTSIPVEEIRIAHASSASTGPRLLWIAFFSFQIFLLFVDGFSFLANPHVFGTGVLVGSIYVLSACVQVVSLILLLFGGNQALTIITGESIYSLNYYVSPWRNNDVASRDSTVLERALGEKFPSAFHENKRELQHPADFKRLVLGIGLLVTPVLSRAFYFYAGEILWFAFLAFGGIVLVQWFKIDLATRGSAVIRAGGAENTPQHVMSRRGWFQDEYFINHTGDGTQNQKRKINLEPALRPRNLIPPDHIVAFGVSLLIGLDIFMTVLLAPAGNPLTAGTIILHVSLGVVFLLLTFITMFDPRPMIEAQTEHWKFQIYAIAVGNPLGSWLSRMRNAVKINPRAFILVIIEFSIAFLIGMLAVMGLFV